MALLPYFLGFALFCIVVSIGLQRRTVWMWYIGWAILYVVAGYLGSFFISGLYYARNLQEEGYACIYLLGGLLLWTPFAVWWSNRRHSFGTRTSRQKKDDATQPN